MNLTANELRIGNWVQRPDELNKPPLVGKKYWVVTIEMLHDCKYYKENFAFEPIPLTEEILLKAGFESIVENNNVYTLKNKIYGMFKTEYNKDGSVSDTYLEIYNEGTPLVKIRTLHHLQNYVHAITQTELTINL